jgi:hypothetical protein
VSPAQALHTFPRNHCPSGPLPSLLLFLGLFREQKEISKYFVNF